jgi:hypothetical protein
MPPLREQIRSVHVFNRPKIRKIFQWKHHNGTIVAVWVTVVAIAALGATLDNAAYLFTLAYLFAFAAGVWSLGSWLSSDTVQKIQCKTTRRRGRGKPYSRRKLLATKWGGSVAIILLFIVTVRFVSGVALRKELEKLGGRLYPASDPLPLNCGPNIQPRDVVIVIGHGAAALADTFPFVVMASQRFGAMVTIERNADGSIVVPLDIRSPDGKVIVRMDENGFVVNRNNILEMRRPDRSSLVIVDQYGNQVLNARYMNRQAFRLTGLINYGGRNIPIEFPGVSGICMVGNGIKNFVPVLIP